MLTLMRKQVWVARYQILTRIYPKGRLISTRETRLHPQIQQRLNTKTSDCYTSCYLYQSLQDTTQFTESDSLIYGPEERPRLSLLFTLRLCALRLIHFNLFCHPFKVSEMLIKNRMHPRNIYKTPPNFKELAIEFPEFRKFVKADLTGKVTLDYQDQKAVKELTRTLLKKDFGLEVDFDESRLIPRVPLSLNYVLWIEDLLENLQLTAQPLGIDIGTGCVCIYSLLAAKKGWKMLATELDPENHQCALKNISQNNLNDVISVKLVSNSNDLLVGVIDKNTIYDFCMCNPPFFNPGEKPLNRTSRRKQLETVASEVPVEMSTEGGEMSFISKLIIESQKLKGQIKIYTTLVGKKSDFVSLKKQVQDICPKFFAFTEFCQGRTTRWGLAWTFLDVDLKDKSESEKLKRSKTKPPLQYILPADKGEELYAVLEDVKKVLNKLKVSFKEESFDIGFTVYFKAHENTWSHQRRKKRLLARAEEIESQIAQNSSVPDEDHKEHSQPKRLKLEEDKTDVIKPVVVESLIALKKIDSSVVFEMSWMSGDKEAVHQIFQYFKNHWNSGSK